MKQDDIITLLDGQKATIIKGDESDYKNIYIVRLSNGQKRVVDRKTRALVEMGVGNSSRKHTYYRKF